MASPALRLRSGVATLTREFSTDLDVVWRQVASAAAAGEALFDILPPLIEAYGSAAGALAAEWYDDLREKQGVGGSFRADPADIENTAGSLIGWAQSQTDDMTAFQTLILGGTQRRVANFARLTVAHSSVRDPQARGWQRVGDGHSCDFCSMLLGRGAVYTEATADFQAHDHCGCYAAPQF